VRTVSATDTQLEAVRTAVEPAVVALGLDVYDVDILGGAGARTLRVTVTKPEGVDLETITAVTHAVSPIVDEAATIGGAFLLEVSSPGVERALRTPAHYSSAIGEQVSVKFHTASGPRRVHGVLRRVDGERCVVESDEGVEEEIPIADVTQARTVFEWGPQPRRPAGGKHKKVQGRARAKGKS
jgi:ribosome maturation factor RimP